MKFSFLVLFVFFTFLVNAQDSTVTVPKKIFTTKALLHEKPPIIDGVIDEQSWDIVDWTGDFVETRPDENTAPRFQSKFKIIYDQKFLYVAFRCYDDEPDKIVERLSRRDGFEGDWIGIFIDSYHDKRTSFNFIVTAAGVKGDEFLTDNGNNSDDSWNPIWYTKTNIDTEGWTAEMKIPLSQIKFGKAEEQVWGLEVMRKLFREEERSIWQRIPREVAGFVSEFGELHGLLNIESQKQLEIQPYSITKLKTYEAEVGNPFSDGNDFNINGGLDAKIGITNDLTLDLTVNPDFGQVEADPSTIALDGFQVFFNERRPFFVENSNIFNFQLSSSQAGNTFGSDNIFYSRRIGRSPQGYPDTEDGEYVDQPDDTPILGAAKFSGKTKDGWSIGVLESVTAKRFATIDANGNRRKEVVEPLTNYFVGRLQKDFNERNTYIGGMFTAVNRKDLTEDLGFLHESAYSGGFDFKHQWKDRAWYVGGNLNWSHVKGSEEAIQSTQESITHLFQRVGADYLEVDEDETSLTGTGGNMQIGNVQGRWKFESGATWRSPELELNDIGFQRQADDIRHYTWIGYQTQKPDSTFRRVGINYNHWSAWDFGGNHNTLQFNTNSWQNWKNNWFSNFGFNYAPIQYSNSALRGGPRLRHSPEVFFWNSIRSDRRKKISFNFFQNGSRGGDDSYKTYRIQGGVTYQPTNSLSISASPSYNTNNNKLQFIENIDVGGDIRYVNGEIEQRTLSMSLRLNYTLNANLSVQYWGQPFISRGRYSNFKFITDPLAEQFTDRFELYNNNQISFNETEDIYEVNENGSNASDFSFENPDFSSIQFRSNLVVRWEYIPGSEIFLVWSQDISQSGNPQDQLFSSLEQNIFGDQKPQNIFLLKATYRFVL